MPSRTTGVQEGITSPSSVDRQRCVGAGSRPTPGPYGCSSRVSDSDLPVYRDAALSEKGSGLSLTRHSPLGRLRLQRQSIILTGGVVSLMMVGVVVSFSTHTPIAILPLAVKYNESRRNSLYRERAWQSYVRLFPTNAVRGGRFGNR